MKQNSPKSTQSVDTNCNTTSLTVNDQCVITYCRDTMNLNGTLLVNHVTAIIVLKGELYLKEDKNIYQIKSNQMLVVPKDSKFERKKGLDQHGQFQVLFIHLNDIILKEYVIKEGVRVPNALNVNDGIVDLNNTMHYYAQGVISLFSEKIKTSHILHKAKELLYIIRDIYPETFVYILTLRSPKKIDLKSFMEENYTNPVNIDVFAKMTGRSLSTFKRDCFKLFNTTPNRWLNEKKLTRAYELLESNSYSVRETSMMVGYENTRYFSKIFKEKFKCTPSSLLSKRKRKKSN